MNNVVQKQAWGLLLVFIFFLSVHSHFKFLSYYLSWLDKDSL